MVIVELVMLGLFFFPLLFVIGGAIRDILRDIKKPP